jgi:hypothetical protein
MVTKKKENMPLILREFSIKFEEETFRPVKK